jgi:hypothetical protein
MARLRSYLLLLITAAVAIGITRLADAQSSGGTGTVFFTVKGDITFPFVSPLRDGTAGTIDNMTIGQTTPRAGKFTSLVSADSLLCTTFSTMGAPAALTDVAIFTATRPLLLVSAAEVHAVAAGGASVVQLTKDTGTQAPGAGTDLLTNTTNTGFNLNGTANTVQNATFVASAASLTFAAGDRLSLDWANAVQASSGIQVTACFAPQ